MSSLVVPVATIDAIMPHGNADALEIAHVLGWQCVVGKGRYSVGDKVVYFPPDTIIPESLSDALGVTKYLSNGRIRCTKLRGEPSFGLVVDPSNHTWEVGENVADDYGATKYLPPVRAGNGDQDRDHPLFVPYTDVENLRNFPDVLQPDEWVVVTEKIHGTNVRVGIVDGEMMAGSRTVRRKRPEHDEQMASSLYWYPWTLAPVKRLLEDMQSHHKQAIIYGEIYGAGIQNLGYGVPKGQVAFRAFDILADGKFLSWDMFSHYTETYGIETVPYLGALQFSLAGVAALSRGKTEVGDTHIREGVVVKPEKERTDPKVGRVILKYLNDDYLLGKASGKYSDSTDQ